MARLFNVEPELLLSHLLIFKIPIEPQVSFTGNLNYEKRIETQALNHMHLKTGRLLRSILENNPSKNGVNEEIADMIKRLEAGI